MQHMSPFDSTIIVISTALCISLMILKFSVSQASAPQVWLVDISASQHVEPWLLQIVVKLKINQRYT